MATLSWNLLPPSVLFLASSREASGAITTAIQGFFFAKGLRVAYLLDPMCTKPTDPLRFDMDNFRTRNNERWEEMVHKLMRTVPAIVIDVRVPSPGVVRETEYNLKSGFSYKTVFVVEPDGRSGLLECLVRSPQMRSVMLVCSEPAVTELIGKVLANERYRLTRPPLSWER
jgi:hypothetical protein